MWEESTYWVYLLASGKHGTLYVGVTNSLARRIWQHKAKELLGFTRTYGVDRLVWYGGFGEVTDAIHFEKQLKRWRREWKIRLIEDDNPNWDDLYFERVAPLSRWRVWVPDSRWRGFRDDTLCVAGRPERKRARPAQLAEPRRGPDAPPSPTDR